MSEAQPSAAARPTAFTPARFSAVTAVSAAAWAAAVLLCGLIGPYRLGWEDWWPRMHRLIPASLVGAGLSVAGVALQSLLRNALASPYILGVSSGSAVGAMLAMMAGAAGMVAPLSMGSITVAAGVGGVVTILLVYAIAQRRGRLDPYTLLLTGVIVTAFNGAVIMFLYHLATQPVFKDFTFWSMGQVREQASLLAVVAAAAVILGGWGVLLLRAKAFNVQALGDDVATSAGVNIHALRLATFVTAALMTAAAVALAGPIAFVGLVVPHITRRIFGPDHRTLLVAAGFVGATFLAAADTLCRTTVILPTGELPVGIVTAFAGGPFFIFLLRRRFREQL